MNNGKIEKTGGMDLAIETERSGYHSTNEVSSED